MMWTEQEWWNVFWVMLACLVVFYLLLTLIHRILIVCKQVNDLVDWIVNHKRKIR